MSLTEKVPKAPQALPLVGHAWKLLRDPLGFLQSLPSYGNLVRIQLGPEPAIVVCDSELTRQLLVDDRTFDKGGLFIERGREIVGDGLASCPHSRHRRQRRLVQPAFHHDRMPAYADVMTTFITDMIETWRDGQILDVPSVMHQLTMNVTCATMFGTQLDASSQAEMLEDLHILLTGMFTRTLLPAFLEKAPTRGNLRHERARARLYETIGRIIEERRRDGIDGGDVLSTLLARPDDVDSPDGLSDVEIANEVVTFFLAGTETTANTLAWALHHLAENPDIESRLQAETSAVLAGRWPDLGDLPALQLTGRIITETLRIRPPLWLLTRIATGDTELGGLRIPAGTTLIYSPYLIHHRSDVYPNPDQFDPDRWTDDETANKFRGSLIPFGGGARKCIGDTFAITQATLALASITARWHLEAVENSRVRPVIRATLGPGGLRMRCVARRV
ncbi:cytochrome P450 [Streptomyces sp. NPDC087901]|uniref:cytochrome P450 n=1 Tax=Streptomyces sp. NPDC087901 TaxID=3365818 RepID=UPI00381536A9